MNNVFHVAHNLSIGVTTQDLNFYWWFFLIRRNGATIYHNSRFYCRKFRAGGYTLSEIIIRNARYSPDRFSGVFIAPVFKKGKLWGLVSAPLSLGVNIYAQHKCEARQYRFNRYIKR